jgi:hypothetical protein
MQALKHHFVCVCVCAGSYQTSVGGDYASLNMLLRQELQLYADVVDCFSIPGIKVCAQSIDCASHAHAHAIVATHTYTTDPMCWWWCVVVVVWCVDASRERECDCDS